MLTKSYLKDLTYRITGACIEVHKAIGPGLFEKAYHKFVKHEFNLLDIEFDSELEILVPYKGVIINTELRCDLLVERIIVVELKAVEKTLPIHEVQLMTYMNLLQAPKGILINFNVKNLYNEGQKTFVNDLFRALPD